MPRKSTQTGLDQNELREVLERARYDHDAHYRLQDVVEFQQWQRSQCKKAAIDPDFRLSTRSGGLGLSFSEFLSLCWNRKIESQSEALIFGLFARQAAASADATAGAAAGAAEIPPLDNMGGKYSDVHSLVVTDTGELLAVPLRTGHSGDAAFIDWVNFTVHADTCMVDQFWGGAVQCVTDDDHILAMSTQLQKIFGLVVTRRRIKGANYYKASYDLGENLGALVCIGGQRNTILVSMSGKSLAAAKPGWEQRLHDWLTTVAIQPRITRADLAHDVLDGSYYNVDMAFQDYVADGYTCGGRRPSSEMRGNWLHPDGCGRTFYVGKRKNGKFIRIYEKGRELGDKSSPWVRVEVEYKSVDRLIPFDVLLKAGEYLAAAAPALAHLSEKQTRILTTQKSVEVAYQASIDAIQHQWGRYIWTICQIEGSAEKAFEKLAKEGVPTRLIVPSYTDQPSQPFQPETLPAELVAEHFKHLLPNQGRNSDNGQIVGH